MLFGCSLNLKGDYLFHKEWKTGNIDILEDQKVAFQRAGDVNQERYP